MPAFEVSFRFDGGVKAGIKLSGPRDTGKEVRIRDRNCTSTTSRNRFPVKRLSTSPRRVPDRNSDGPSISGLF
jgi:hypothetical protein